MGLLWMSELQNECGSSDTLFSANKTQSHSADPIKARLPQAFART